MQGTLTNRRMYTYSDNLQLKDLHNFTHGEEAIILDCNIYSTSHLYAVMLNADLSKVYLNDSTTKRDNTSYDLNKVINKKCKVIGQSIVSICGVKVALIEYDGWQFIIDHSALQPIKNNGGSMINKNIVKLFPVTEQAILVAKYFGSQVSDFEWLLAEYKLDKILAYCHAKEKEESEK